MYITQQSLILAMSLCVASGFTLTSQTQQQLSSASVCRRSTSLLTMSSNCDNDHLVERCEPTVGAREARITGPFTALMTPLFGMGDAAFADSDQTMFDKSLNAYFPGSITNSEITYRMTKVLRSRGYNEKNTIIGSSLCSDEINDTSSSFVTTLAKKVTSLGYGGVFNLGGLGGLPFVGTSGFGAFTSHTPKNGKIIIIFGPHVGVSNDGVIGKVERVGKVAPSTSCGAAVGAYKALMAGTVDYNAPLGTRDFQEEYIIQNLRKKLGPLAEVEKKGGDGSVTYVTQQMYNLVWDIMRFNVETFASKPGFWDSCTEVILLGGIVVNRGHGVNLVGGDDFFQPLTLTTINAQGESNIYGDVFGDLKTPKGNVASGFDRTKIKEVRGPDIFEPAPSPPTPAPVTPAPAPATPTPPTSPPAPAPATPTTPAPSTPTPAPATPTPPTPPPAPATPATPAPPKPAPAPVTPATPATPTPPTPAPVTATIAPTPPKPATPAPATPTPAAPKPAT